MTTGEFWLRDEDFDELDLGHPGLNYDTWTCVKCMKEFVDPEDFPNAKPIDGEQIETRLYWLSELMTICSSCAIAAGIPPIDEG